jgi:hypothetical protein
LRTHTIADRLHTPARDEARNGEFRETHPDASSPGPGEAWNLTDLSAFAAGVVPEIPRSLDDEEWRKLQRFLLRLIFLLRRQGNTSRAREARTLLRTLFAEVGIYPAEGDE